MNQITIVVDSEIFELSKNYVRKRLLGMTELKNAVKAKNLKAIAEFAHSMKGSGGAYEMQPLSDYAGEIERAIKKGDFDTIAASIEAIHDYLQRVNITVKLVK